jgi:hypothetical protein
MKINRREFVLTASAIGGGCWGGLSCRVRGGQADDEKVAEEDARTSPTKIPPFFMPSTR